ncbi:hypothetical protein L5C07_31610, partial [Pseudomonas aeruginosa]|nr:hypothetical protein [Pseudomonas aeruginosa]MDG4344301.1 hypothetical protein [Pseudomonas aeruginosa]
RRSRPGPVIRDRPVRRRPAPGRSAIPPARHTGAIGQIVGRPCQSVVNEWDRNHGEGWGVVAQRMGIKPGSAEFHRLKRGFVPTYDRWSRPIRLDADLQRHFPNRGNQNHQGNQNNQGNQGNRGRGQDHQGNQGNRGQGQGNNNRGNQGNRGQGQGNNRGNQGRGGG